MNAFLITYIFCEEYRWIFLTKVRYSRILMVLLLLWTACLTNNWGTGHFWLRDSHVNYHIFFNACFKKWIHALPTWEKGRYRLSICFPCGFILLLYIHVVFGVLCISGVLCWKQVSRVGTDTVECNYLSLPLIPASGRTLLILSIWYDFNTDSCYLLFYYMYERKFIPVPIDNPWFDLH